MLSAMIEEDGYDSDALLAGCEYPRDDIGASLGYLGWEVTATYTVSA